MHVAQIFMSNWGPFEGEHVVDLEPTTYGVSGENWAGKSRLVGAIPFALYGEHPARTEDDWITRGRPSGMVAVALSTGAKVERGRKRGKSTKLVVTLEDGVTQCEGQKAEAELARMLVLSKDDFFVSCYFRQKSIAQIVTMKPEPRLAIVSSWVGLEHADRCIDIAAAVLDDAERRLAAEEQRLEASRGWFRDAKAQAFPGAVAKTDEELEQAAAAGVELSMEEERKAREAAADEGRARTAQQYAAVVASGKAQRAGLDAMLSAAELDAGAAEAERVLTETIAIVGAKNEDRRRSLTLVNGGFDGTCPVAGIPCPARAELEGSIEDARANAAQLEEELDELEKRRSEDAATSLEWSSLKNDRALKEQRVADLRERARLLLKEMGGTALTVEGELPSAEEIMVERRRLADALADAARSSESAAAWLAEVQRRRADGAAIEKQVAEAREQARACGAALLVCERARREVLRASAADIERGANRILAACGIPLEATFSWEREGKKAARNCSECGAGFPPSLKVKECQRCGAPRGLAVQEKLEVSLSNVSGAAEDLAGVAMQLSAASWLRRRRSAPWTTAVIDEPFGALTPKNRKLLAQHLAAVLTVEGGFRQAFVIAHQPDALAGMKRAIEVVPGADGRSRCVVS